VVKILQSSVVTQTKLGGLTIYPPVANFLWCMCAKNYENWLAVVMANRLSFLAHPVCIMKIIHEVHNKYIPVEYNLLKLFIKMY